MYKTIPWRGKQSSEAAKQQRGICWHTRLITSNGRVPTGRRWGCRRCRVVGHVGVDLELASGVTRDGHCLVKRVC